MQNQVQKALYNIRKIVELKEGEQIHIHRVIGPQTYQTVGNEILKSGLRVPTGKETAPVINVLYCSSAKDEPEFRKARELVRNSWLWVFNQNTYTDKGMYSIHDNKEQGRSKSLSVRFLEKMLKGGTELSLGGIRFSKDGRVAFAPVGSYTLGKQTPQSLAKQGDVIIQYGVHGAELLGEVTEVIGKPAYTYGVVVQEDSLPEVRVSALGEGDGGLHVYSDGCAFSVSAPQN